MSHIYSAKESSIQHHSLSALSTTPSSATTCSVINSISISIWLLLMQQPFIQQQSGNRNKNNKQCLALHCINDDGVAVGGGGGRLFKHLKTLLLITCRQVLTFTTQ